MVIAWRWVVAVALIAVTSSLSACTVHIPSVEARSQGESALTTRMEEALDVLDPFVPSLLRDPESVPSSLTPEVSGINVIVGLEDVTVGDVPGKTTLYGLEEDSGSITAHLLVEGYGAAGGRITDASVGLYGCATATGTLGEPMPDWNLDDEDCPQWLSTLRAHTQSRYTETSVVAAIEANAGKLVRMTDPGASSRRTRNRSPRCNCVPRRSSRSQQAPAGGPTIGRLFRRVALATRRELRGVLTE
ncbi:hypothetical protein GCM10009777_40090 [Microbacterium pumilum]|uniref:Uncharacterized protein n=1 Tax=Microbacterium pumilum TaxID=344165 RepID=A0ABP5EKR4_9MICO